MPILVRPVREQLEHDRIIRLLEAKWRRKFKVEANPGDERNAGVKVPAGTLYPDLVLTEEGGRKPKALIEVETNESVNHREAMAQWANLAKARTSLVLFVPVGVFSACVVSRAAGCGLQDHLLAFGVAVAVHVSIIIHVRRRLSYLSRSEVRALAV